MWKEAFQAKSNDEINRKQRWRFERDSPFDFLNQFELLELNFNILLKCMRNSCPVTKIRPFTYLG